MKTHYQTDYDRKHGWTYCGRDIRGSLAYRTNRRKVTTRDKAKVTCKACLNRMPDAGRVTS